MKPAGDAGGNSWNLISRLEPPRPWRARGDDFSPTDGQCFEWWDRFGMLPNIREHSLLVAKVATSLAQRAKALGMAVNVQMVRASALLHDLAKTYTIRHGGNHGQLGGAWAQEITGNSWLAMGIVHHVHWPWHIDVLGYFLPMAIIYADKRIMHDRLVSLDERFADLYARYGTNDHIRNLMAQSMEQAQAIESALSQTLGSKLREDSFDSGRLV